MQFFFDQQLVGLRRTLPYPGPLLNEKLLLLAICLEIDGGDNFIADQHGQGEITEQPLFLRNIGLEAMSVVEEQLQPLALNDQRVERRQHMNHLRFGWRWEVECL